MTAPTGLLVMAYGTASGPDDIERYYTDIRGGRTPAPEHLEELIGRYAAIGNNFPLLDTTTEQAQGIASAGAPDRRPRSAEGYARGMEPPRPWAPPRPLPLPLVTERLTIDVWRPLDAPSLWEAIDTSRSMLATDLQLDGKKRMNAREFLRGHPIAHGEIAN